MSSSYHLDTWDYVTGTMFVLISCGVGLYHVSKSGKYTNFKRFLVSSDELGLIPIILSNVSTIVSAVGILGYSVEFYMNGIIFFISFISWGICALVGAYVNLPVFYRLSSNTIFELFYSAVVIYGPALALSQVTGLDLWTSVTSVTIICTVYTAFGGFDAVVWADVVQTSVMFLFLLIIIIQGLIEGGGFAPVWEKLETGQRLELSSFSSNTDLQISFWTILVGSTFGQVAFLTISQSLMQRCKSCPNLKKAQRAYVGGLFATACLYFLVGCAGLLMYAHYSNCDPLLNGEIKVRDQTLPLYAILILSKYKGLSGIFIAGILSATLSTLSSNLNSAAVITISDFVSIFKTNLSDKSSIKISRLLILLYGCISLALVRLCENMGGVIAAMWAIFGICSGPVFAVFAMGMLLPWVNSTGALIGFFSAMVLPVWALAGKMITSPVINTLPISIDGCSNYSVGVTNITEVIKSDYFLQEFYSLSSFWYTSWSFGVGLITALIASKLTGYPDFSQINSQLYCSFVVKYINRNQANIVNRECANVETNGHRPLMEAYKM